MDGMDKGRFTSAANRFFNSFEVHEVERIINSSNGLIAWPSIQFIHQLNSWKVNIDWVCDDICCKI